MPACVLFPSQAHYRDYGKMTYARCAFVIHNMAHQVGRRALGIG